MNKFAIPAGVGIDDNRFKNNPTGIAIAKQTPINAIERIDVIGFLLMAILRHCSKAAS